MEARDGYVALRDFTWREAVAFGSDAVKLWRREAINEQHVGADRGVTYFS
jgi:hypothetical protein